MLMLGKTEGWRRGWLRTSWLYDITNSMGMSLSKLWEIVKYREAWCAADHGVTKRRTWLSNSRTIPDLCDWRTWWWESLDSSDQKRHKGISWVSEGWSLCSWFSYLVTSVCFTLWKALDIIYLIYAIYVYWLNFNHNFRQKTNLWGLLWWSSG